MCGYIGRQVNIQRQHKTITDVEACRVMDISLQNLALREHGLRRFPVSDLFSLRKKSGIELDSLFSHKGDYYPDVILDTSEMADVFHYFSNIQEPHIRARLLKLMKNASSVF